MSTQRQAITHEEIQRALREFRREGRMITRLPEQVVPAELAVRARGGLFETEMEEISPAVEGLI